MLVILRILALSWWLVLTSSAAERKVLGFAPVEGETATTKITVMGCVRKPGVFEIAAPMPIRQALQLAGGAYENPYDFSGRAPQPSASMSRIHVHRLENGFRVVYVVNLGRRGPPEDAGFLILPKDRIEVPEVIF